MSEEQSKGLGDTVEKIITKIGETTQIEFIRNKKGCESCRKRKEALNKMFPYGTSKTNEEATTQKQSTTESDCPECEKKRTGPKVGGCKKCGKN